MTADTKLLSMLAGLLEHTITDMHHRLSAQQRALEQIFKLQTAIQQELEKREGHKMEIPF
jgi:hypothetical protein